MTGDAPERIAQAFHERLAPEHGYETREASAVPWSASRTARSMIAVVAELLAGGVIHP